MTRIKGSNTWENFGTCYAIGESSGILGRAVERQSEELDGFAMKSQTEWMEILLKTGEYCIGEEKKQENRHKISIKKLE